eukprot:jgi/Mesvir1/7015/Mv09147-RA.1
MVRGRGRGKFTASSRGGPRVPGKREDNKGKQQNAPREQAIPPSKSRKPDVHDSEDSDDDIDAQLNTDPQSLYSKLLSSLSASGGAFAQVYKHRQRDETGGSDEDSEDNDEEDGGDDGSGSEEEGGSSDEGGASGQESEGGGDDEDCSSSSQGDDHDDDDDIVDDDATDDDEDDGAGAGSGDDDDDDNSESDEDDGSRGLHEEEEDDEELVTRRAGKAAAGKKRKHGTSAAEEDDGGGRHGKQLANKGRASEPHAASGAEVEGDAREANGDGAPRVGEDDDDEDKAEGAVPSSWSAHVNHVMTEADVVALTTAQGQRRVYQPVAPAKGVRNAQWLAAGVASSEPPKELPSLQDYGLKLALLRKWRQLRAEAGGAAGGSGGLGGAHGAASSRAGAGDQKKKEKKKGGKGAERVQAAGTQQGVALEEPSAPDFVSSQQQQFFSLLNSYADVQLPSVPLVRSQEALRSSSALTDAWLLHVVDHVMKSQAVIQKHSARQQKKAQEAAERRRQLQEQARAEGGPPGKKGKKKQKNNPASEGGGGAEGTPAWDQGPTDEGPAQDQGFTRPQVLLLLPMRSVALRVVKRLVELMPLTHAPEGHSRLLQEFGDPDDEEGATGRDKGKGGLEEEAARLFGGGDKEPGDGSTKQGESSFMLTGAKPPDYRHLFAGNTDDHFRFGVKLTKKSLKLFTPFYDSDIVVASPLGLVTRINEADEKGQTDVDFLSSIQILVMEMTDVMYMQNWAHVQTVVEHVNQLPTSHHGTDIMRIREWFLNGWGKFYRQTIILSSFANADMNALFNRTCTNFKGKYKLRCEHEGVLGRIVPQVRQIFERFHCGSIADADDARFTFFTSKIYPRLRDSVQNGVLLFVPLYFDYVKLRNFLKKEEASFCSLCEYTDQSDISRGRTLFFRGERRFMLYTERAHFYRRFRIRGIRELIFYSLPEHSHFYAEILNLLEGQDNLSCTVLFNRFDNLQLERIVGSSRATRMIKSDKNVFMFVDE